MGISIDRAMSTTAYLKLIAEHDLCIYLEKGAPYTQLKGEVITIRTKDGRHVQATLGGFHTSQIQLERAQLDDLLRQSFVAQQGPEKDGVILYHLTTDGKARGLAQ